MVRALLTRDCLGFDTLRLSIMSFGTILVHFSFSQVYGLHVYVFMSQDMLHSLSHCYRFIAWIIDEASENTSHKSNVNLQLYGQQKTMCFALMHFSQNGTRAVGFGRPGPQRCTLNPLTPGARSLIAVFNLYYMLHGCTWRITYLFFFLFKPVSCVYSWFLSQESTRSCSPTVARNKIQLK